MPTETFIALIGLAIATLFTPGPNNAMLAASGAAFGFRRSLPHLTGVALGFPAMLLIVGLALGGLFQTSVVLREGLRWGGALLLLWIAFKIATSAGAESKSAARPMTFLAAVAFQWINPKAWSMAIAATSQFIRPDDPWRLALIVAATFTLLGLGSASTWVGLGQAISGWLTTAGRLRLFNLTMAGLIVLSTLQILSH
ncbi:LysE family translocator [Frigidibacter sp. RF13]|uniref:LysE family translocator n=1 Tax=Frigidibacter sp. RF13 TaxID=2997340 RepID=UPI002271174D|nr:LysE family translocator [Frigidibacter sp. RF13]MCY1126740.1 LysE family translocator [Frigidibacter sp. RF13]